MARVWFQCFMKEDTSKKAESTSTTVVDTEPIPNLDHNPQPRPRPDPLSFASNIPSVFPPPPKNKSMTLKGMEEPFPDICLVYPRYKFRELCLENQYFFV